VTHRPDPLTWPTNLTNWSDWPTNLTNLTDRPTWHDRSTWLIWLTDQPDWLIWLTWPTDRTTNLTDRPELTDRPTYLTDRPTSLTDLTDRPTWLTWPNWPTDQPEIITLDNNILPLYRKLPISNSEVVKKYYFKSTVLKNMPHCPTLLLRVWNLPPYPFISPYPFIWYLRVHQQKQWRNHPIKYFGLIV